MGIQILQYEFMGPIPLDDWGPPMEKLIYLILSRTKDNFDVIYAGDCEKTDEKAYFVQHPQFKCWAEQARSEKQLYLAILPLFESTKEGRQAILAKIVGRYKPACNPAIYDVKCLCCGTKMAPEKQMARSTIYRCPKCNMTDTRLNS